MCAYHIKRQSQAEISFIIQDHPVQGHPVSDWITRKGGTYMIL